MLGLWQGARLLRAPVLARTICGSSNKVVVASRHTRRVACAATTAACAAFVWVAPPATQCDGTAANPSDSPYVYKELTEGTARRVASQHALMQYMRSMQQVLGALRMQLRTGGLGEGEVGTAKYWERMRQLQSEVGQRTQEILYGVAEPGARAAYEETYGCVRWTEPALRTVAAHSPLIEIGAGAGHWQRELAQRGADILAFENGEEVPLPQAGEPVGKVQAGDHTVLPLHPGRTLFLCYPPAGPMASECLARYKGSMLVYVGEGRQGVNGSDAFFDTLEQQWLCVEVVPLQPFAECFERLYVLKRMFT